MHKLKTLIRTDNIENALIHEIYISLDESVITLDISMIDNKKFIISRDFNNNIFGLGKMEEFKKNLSSVNDFKFYLGV